MDTQCNTVRVKNTPPTIDDVLPLARQGLPIIPLAPGTKQPPRGFTDWKAQATTDPATLTAWWQEWPDANIGHVIPPGRLVVDIDPRNGGLVGWKNLLARHGDLPPTWRVWSGRQDQGFH